MFIGMSHKDDLDFGSGRAQKKISKNVRLSYN